MKIILNSNELMAMQKSTDNIIDKINALAIENGEDTTEPVNLLEGLGEGKGYSITTDSGNITMEYDEELTVDIMNLYEDIIGDSLPVFMKVYKMFDKIKEMLSPFKSIITELGILELKGKFIVRTETFAEKWL